MRFGSLITDKGSIKLSGQVKIRHEYFGGIIFHSGTGDIVEVDREAFQVLLALLETGPMDISSLSTLGRFTKLLPIFMDMGIIEYSPEGMHNSSDTARLLNSNNSPDISCRTSQTLSAPETVHLAVTYRCNKACPDCYISRYATPPSYELNTAEMCSIIDTLAKNAVFQLAIGGGEPFIRLDLDDIVKHAGDMGLAVHITTGQYSIKPEWEEMLKHIKSLHIGVQSEELLRDAAVSKELSTVEEHLRSLDIGFGANIILTRFTIRNMDKILESLLQCGFKRIIFLRYKPIANKQRWASENPGAHELEFFRNWLTEATRRHKQIMFRVDCAASFLMKAENPTDAMRHGVKGCSAGERILSIAPDGSAYPCSQLFGHRLSAGNLLAQSFESIWGASETLNSYRRFRQNPSFKNGVCGRCEAADICGGCRVYSEDFIGSEPACPIR